MTLAFPNLSRSFDEARNAVRFIGHDGMFEVPFFIEAGALARAEAGIGKTKPSEAECLRAFDAVRGSDDIFDQYLTNLGGFRLKPLKYMVRPRGIEPLFPP